MRHCLRSDPGAKESILIVTVSDLPSPNYISLAYLLCPKSSGKMADFPDGNCFLPQSSGEMADFPDGNCFLSKSSGKMRFFTDGMPKIPFARFSGLPENKNDSAFQLSHF